jgi:hypothetical protein
MGCYCSEGGSSAAFIAANSALLRVAVQVRPLLAVDALLLLSLMLLGYDIVFASVCPWAFFVSHQRSETKNDPSAD